jgi:2-polyprenyl-3-methyl-5-hydroxy-6-metoxy-1,4-benzoquinol methylase
MTENNGNDALSREAEAFDRQIRERVAGGHLPDLRRAKPCGWFYNNSWRHPALVDLDFGEIFRRIRRALVEHLPLDRKRILEIGCGPGHISLELSRSGYDVTGVDLSPACIEVARRVAEEDPWKAQRGVLRYFAGDVFALADRLEPPFDAVVFVGALHHFPDQEFILSLCDRVLSSGGIILANEPVRDRTTRGNATVLALIRLLLSRSGTWFSKMDIPLDEAALNALIDTAERELSCLDEHGGKAQSENDNEAGYVTIRQALSRLFDLLEEEPRHALYHQLAGGIRFSDDDNTAVAGTLMRLDRVLIREGVLSPTEYFFLARKR